MGAIARTQQPCVAANLGTVSGRMVCGLHDGQVKRGWGLTMGMCWRSSGCAAGSTCVRALLVTAAEPVMAVLIGGCLQWQASGHKAGHAWGPPTLLQAPSLQAPCDVTCTSAGQQTSVQTGVKIFRLPKSRVPLTRLLHRGAVLCCWLCCAAPQVLATMPATLGSCWSSPTTCWQHQQSSCHQCR